MSEYAVIIVEMELSAGVWTDVSADVLQAPGIKGKQGMDDSSPTTRVATTGSFSFTLRNDKGCSGGVANYYTPGHPNCITGFKTGIAIRLRVTYNSITQTVIYGRVPTAGIKMRTGLLIGSVTVEVVDYMEQLAMHEVLLPEFTTNKTMEEIVPLIVANVPLAPLDTQYNDGETTYATVFDTLRPKTRAIGELNKVALSELGYIYTHPGYDPLGGAVADEVLEADGQLTRSNTVDPASIYVAEDHTISFLLQENGEELLQENGEEILLNFAGIPMYAVFDNSMIHIQTSHATNYYNAVKVTIPTRRVDTNAAVLYSNPKPFAVTAGQTKSLKVNFRDPDNLANNVTCSLLTVPAAGTDYKFTENEDGTGADRTASAGFSYVAGVEGIEFTFAPTLDGWVFILQARGKGVYTYDPVEKMVEDTALTGVEGSKMLSLDMKYRDRPLAADDIASVFLDRYSQKETHADKVTFVANRSEFLMMAFLALQVGDKIWVTNTQAGIDEAYFINGKEFDISEGGIIKYSYILCPSAYDSYTFWELEEVGKSELQQTTWLGFG